MSYLDASITRGSERSLPSSLHGSLSCTEVADGSVFPSSPAQPNADLHITLPETPSVVGGFGPYQQHVGQLMFAAEDIVRSDMIVGQSPPVLQASPLIQRDINFAPYQQQYAAQGQFVENCILGGTPVRTNWAPYPQIPQQYAIPVPCVPKEVADAEIADEHKEITDTIVDGVLNGLSMRERHTEVLEAITNVVVRPPDLSGITNILSGISNAVSGVGAQVGAQGQVLQALSRRLELLEQQGNGKQFQDLQTEFRTLGETVQAKFGTYSALHDNLAELHRKVQDQGQTLQKELRNLQLATSDSLEQLIEQSGTKDSDLEALSCSVVEKLRRKPAGRADAKTAPQDLQSLTSIVQDDFLNVTLKVDNSEVLTGIEAMHDQLAETVYQKMKKVCMKLEAELLKDQESLARGVAQAIDFSPVLDAIAQREVKQGAVTKLSGNTLVSEIRESGARLQGVTKDDSAGCSRPSTQRAPERFQLSPSVATAGFEEKEESRGALPPNKKEQSKPTLASAENPLTATRVKRLSQSTGSLTAAKSSPEELLSESRIGTTSQVGFSFSSSSLKSKVESDPKPPSAFSSSGLKIKEESDSKPAFTLSSSGWKSKLEASPRPSSARSSSLKAKELAADSKPTSSLSSSYLKTKAATCACGNTYMADSDFCRKCGLERPDCKAASSLPQEASTLLSSGWKSRLESSPRAAASLSSSGSRSKLISSPKPTVAPSASAWKSKVEPSASPPLSSRRPSSSPAPKVDKDGERPFSCLCGYSCGTNETLERHLTRFAGQPRHGACKS